MVRRVEGDESTVRSVDLQSPAADGLPSVAPSTYVSQAQLGDEGQTREFQAESLGTPDEFDTLLSPSLEFGATHRSKEAAGANQEASASHNAEASAGRESTSNTTSTGAVPLPDRQAYYRRVARLGEQVAGAIAYAHSKGIMHRDIKPANLILDADCNVWVTDFGLAKREDDGLTRTGAVVGTLRYMSPERFRGHCVFSSDLYALGMTLYEMLALKPAFSASDQVSLMEHIQRTEVPKLRTVDNRIPRDLEPLFPKLRRSFQKSVTRTL